MTTIQLVIAVAGFLGLLAAIVAGAWSNQRSIDRQMESMRNEINSFRNEIKAELRAEVAPVKAELRMLNEKVSRIDQLFERLYKPVLPGQGD